MEATPHNSLVVRNEPEPIVKMRSVSIRAKSAGEAREFQLLNSSGLPIDLTGVDVSNLSGSVSEAAEGVVPTAVTVSILEAAEGKLTLEFSSMAPGVYRGSICLTSDEGTVVENPFLLYVAAATGEPVGPPTLLEVRLQLRDSSVDENFLLDSLSFTDEEIALAAIRPIQYFNEVSPDIGIYFTTGDFPWRYHWVEGMVAQLFNIAAEGYRKNSLQYNAGGLSVADMEKERNYIAAYQERWASYMQFVRSKKGSIAMSQVWSCVPGPYGFIR